MKGRKTMNKPSNQKHKRIDSASVVALGISLGAIVGMMFDQLALGAALGVMFGIVVGSIFDEQAKKKNK